MKRIVPVAALAGLLACVGALHSGPAAADGCATCCLAPLSLREANRGPGAIRPSNPDEEPSCQPPYLMTRVGGMVTGRLAAPRLRACPPHTPPQSDGTADRMWVPERQRVGGFETCRL